MHVLLNKTKAILLLGHRNDASGKLSDIAQARLDLAFSLWHAEPCYILCTGGHSAAFNPSVVNHGEYTQQALRSRGVPCSAFLPVAPSMFTFEDATLSKPILESHQIQSALIVSSEFHIKRVKLIFDYIYQGVDVNYQAAESPVSTQELMRLAEHERNVIERELATIERLSKVALNGC